MARPTLPTNGMGWDEFEAFTDDLLTRLRFVPDATPRLVASWRVGKPGQDQRGIDLMGNYSDGSTATWQCKEQRRLTGSDVENIIKDTEVEATHHFIVYSGEADSTASKAIEGLLGWAIWDRRTLENYISTLPAYQARTLLDRHFGSAVRRRFLANAGTSAFLTLEEAFGPFMSEARFFHHNAALVGRDDDLAKLVAALTDFAGSSVVLVDAPAGRGKSRLILEVLRQAQREQPLVPVLVRADTRILDTAAMEELPDGPAILLVEDIHHDVVGASTVLQYVRQTAGRRAVLTSRPSGTKAIMEMVARQFDLSEVVVCHLDRLTAPAARELVKALRRDDVAITAAFAETLAQSARATPLVAVVAIAMIRRGELSTALALDSRFREEILTRYGQVTTDGVPGVPVGLAQSILALVAAIGPVDYQDSALVTQMARFIGISGAQVLDVFSHLIDHGVLLDRAHRLQVVPDVLADEVLMHKAVQLRTDTGYISEVWALFSADRAAPLVRNVAELDWRLRSSPDQDGRSAPDLFAPIWNDLHREAIAADSMGRARLLSMLSPIAALQSDRTFHLISDILESPPTESEDDQPWQFRFSDVQRIAAPMLRDCAMTNSAVAPAALDLLWKMARSDSRSTDQNTDHPGRIILDMGNLGQPGSLRMADFIIDAVERWLRSPDGPDAVRTPLFAVKPLVEKETLTMEWAPQHALQMSPRFFDAEKTRGLRDRVRTLLLSVGTDSEIRRAVNAVELLADALKRPHGYFGQPVGLEYVLSWTDDDLTTLSVLEQIASATDEPVVRLSVRDAVDWHAAHAPSDEVKQRSVDLIASLDEHVEDSLTDLIRGWPRMLVPLGGARQQFGSSATSTDDGRQGDVRARTDDSENSALREHERELSRMQRERALIVSQMWTSGTADTIVSTIVERLNALKSVGGTRSTNGGLQPLMAAIVAERPAQAAALIRAIQNTEAHDLDWLVWLLLNQLSQDDAKSFRLTFSQLLGSRPSLAIGSIAGFQYCPWATDVEGAAELLVAALDHEDRSIALAAVSALGCLVRSDILSYADRLVRAASDGQWRAASTALEQACQYRPDEWIGALNSNEMHAVLGVLAAFGEWDYLMERMVSTLSGHLTDEVLGLLSDRAVDGVAPLPLNVDGLPEALNEKADVLETWVRTTSLRSVNQWSQLALVWPLIAGRPPLTPALTAVKRIAASSSPHELGFLTRCISNSERFSIDHIELVTELVEALDGCPTEIREIGLADLRASAACRSWTRAPGHPASEMVQRRDAARALAERADLTPSVRELYTVIAANFQQSIEDDLRRDAAEDD